MSESASPAKKSPDRLTVVLRWVVGIVLGLLLLAGAWYAYAYSTSPASIRQPAQEHYHVRLQYINNGKPANFGEAKYQTPFNKDICTADLTKEPIHFHDNLDQFLHIHWKGITGGMVLKHYGLNLIGGPDDTLGYRFDQLPGLTRVPIHGLALPHPSDGANYYVYVSTSVTNPTAYRKQSWDAFLNQDLSEFIKNTPSARAPSWLDRLIPAAYAHGTEEHGMVESAAATSAGTPSEVEKARLNNVIGNVVIIAQKKEPSDEQVKTYFEKLIALPDSACAG